MEHSFSPEQLRRVLGSAEGRQRPAFSLASGGLLFAECGWKQGEQAAQLFRQAGWKNVHLREDLAGIPRIVCAEKF